MLSRDQIATAYKVKVDKDVIDLCYHHQPVRIGKEWHECLVVCPHMDSMNRIFGAALHNARIYQVQYVEHEEGWFAIRKQKKQNRKNRKENNDRVHEFNVSASDLSRDTESGSD